MLKILRGFLFFRKFDGATVCVQAGIGTECVGHVTCGYQTYILGQIFGMCLGKAFAAFFELREAKKVFLLWLGVQVFSCSRVQNQCQLVFVVYRKRCMRNVPLTERVLSASAPAPVISLGMREMKSWVPIFFCISEKSRINLLSLVILFFSRDLS